ncbi:hypothetical protein SAMN04490244_103387 [Tranquillimonas rosea]|uniref:Transposase, Mutator family n=1 Tax=Tranquillimonas rosea TaxID=641238 RepID=A0A1H9STR8_9RHOB|nr:hypothetical protein [Tranquillimonas rosea]SER88267.1 hypothetical protein SAMN04490244_103387 [Tranquillimonas rosea]
MTKKIDAKFSDEMMAGWEQSEDLLGDGGLMQDQDLKRALMQRMLGTELTEHLGYERGAEAPPVQANRRNVASRKTTADLLTRSRRSSVQHCADAKCSAYWGVTVSVTRNHSAMNHPQPDERRLKGPSGGRRPVPGGTARVTCGATRRRNRCRTRAASER